MTVEPVASLELLLTVIVIVLPLAWLGWAARRHVCLFRVEAEAGEIKKLWGRMPPRLLGDLLDVLARQQPKQLRMRCMLESGRAVVVFEDNSDAEVRQILRNLIGQYPAIRLKSAPRLQNPRA